MSNLGIQSRQQFYTNIKYMYLRSNSFRCEKQHDGVVGVLGMIKVS